MNKLHEDIVKLYEESKRMTFTLKRLIVENQINTDEVVFNTELSAEKIKQIVEEQFEVKIPLKGKANRKIFDARKCLCYMLRLHTEMNLKMISEFIGACDHTISRRNINEAKNLIENDTIFRYNVYHIEKNIANYKVFN